MMVMMMIIMMTERMDGVVGNGVVETEIEEGREVVGVVGVKDECKGEVEIKGERNHYD